MTTLYTAIIDLWAYLYNGEILYTKSGFSMVSLDVKKLTFPNIRNLAEDK